MTPFMRPVGAPGCWGQQFTDGDQECSQCAMKDSCRSTCLSRAALPAPVPTAVNQIAPLPPPRPYMAQSVPPQPLPPNIVQPQVQMARVQPAQVMQYQPQQAPVFAVHPQTAQMVQYQQQQLHPSLPDPNNPHPLTPMMRPGAPGPAYYFCQYPGESTVQRLGKNMSLRAAEAIFGEAMFFFRHWTWPPRT